MGKFKFWLLSLFGLDEDVDYHCTYKRNGSYHCKCQSMSHHGGHYRCKHCTNPEIVCGLCGANYFDIVKPGSNWIYRGLLRGWEHVVCPKRLVR